MVDENKSADTNADFTAPAWINAGLIESALHKCGEKDLKVKTVSVRIGTAAGDNYSSTIYRATAELSDGSERSFLLKAPPPGQIAEMAKEAGGFGREALMLMQVVPQIQVILEEAAPGKFPPIAARCPIHGFEPVEYLVLEDLMPQGFKLADRKRGLDFDHSLLALRSLARYHAASHALLRKQPELGKKMPSVLKHPIKATEIFVETGAQVAADACRSWPGFEEYVAILDKYKAVAMDTMKDIGDLKPGDFNVIIHADFWVNNMMFRYEDGDPKPRGHRMVDFQCSTESSPALDLHYFLSTSVNEEVSANSEDILIEEYHRELKDTLTLLGLQPPSLETLLADMKARGVVALFSTLNVIPIVRGQRPANMEAFLTGDAPGITYLYEDPVVKKWMQRVLPEYKRKGWLPG